MTLGDGILWSTILILLAVSIYLLSIKKKWKSFGKVLGIIVLAGTLIGLGTWGWYTYQDRPQMTTSLGGISLGVFPVAVSLKLGEPSRKIEAHEVENPSAGSEYSMIWLYSGNYEGDKSLFIRFYGPDPFVQYTSVICQFNGHDDVVGVNRYNSEEQIVERLGEPTNVSINEDGTEKYISYKQWSAAFQMEKGKVKGVCLTRSGKVSFGNEYGPIRDPE